MYYDKIRCYVCLKLGHNTKDYKQPYISNKSRQMMKSNPNKQNYESKRSADFMMNPNKVWKEKRKGEPIISIT